MPSNHLFHCEKKKKGKQSLTDFSEMAWFRNAIFLRLHIMRTKKSKILTVKSGCRLYANFALRCGLHGTTNFAVRPHFKAKFSAMQSCHAIQPPPTTKTGKRANESYLFYNE